MKYLISVYYQEVLFRDIENLSKAPVFSHQSAHSEIINAIDGAGGLGQEGAPELVTGLHQICSFVIKGS